MDKFDERLGPGEDTWEDRLGPDDDEWWRTRAERWFDRHRRLLAGVALMLVLAPLVWLTRTGRLDDVLGLDVRAPMTTLPASVVVPPPGLVLDGAPLDRARPFAGTPEDGWADGAAGVVAPAVEPWQTSKMPAERQAAALERVRQVVVAARLDPRVLRDGDVEPLLALFAPEQREELRARLASDDGGSVATRLAAGERLLDVAPKVSGGMSVSVPEPGVAVVRTSFSFAYAFDTERGLRNPADAVAKAIHQVTYEVRGDSVHLAEAHSTYVGGACEGTDRSRISPPVSGPHGLPCIR